MTSTPEQILSYQSVDFVPFEIRGAKFGVNNARTTGPVYIDGTYVPYRSTLYNALGRFDGTDSSVITDFQFGPPYGFLDASAMRVNDTITVDSTVYTVTGQLDSSSLVLDKNPPVTGSYTDITLQLGEREYLIEPDQSSNDSYGLATFTSGSDVVTGSGTTWLTDMTVGDFIKYDGYQQNYSVKQVLTDTTLQLTSAYTGLTVSSGRYTARKVRVGRMFTQYVRNNFTYNKQSGRWEYDATTGSHVPTSTSFLPLADGITEAFTHSLSSDAPDLMEKATVNFKTFAKQTQYDTFQFPLPVVPNPEESLEVHVNNVKKDRYPNGNHDYVASYSQNPVWEPPPAPQERRVANLMFLNGVRGQVLNQADTEEGQIQFKNSAGNNVTGIMPGSETVRIDNTAQVWARDYVLESNSGVAVAVDYTVNEPLVKYVASDMGGYVDYGFSAYLNGRRLQVSFPPKNTDDILFQPRSGRIKPQKQSKPGPGETYEIYYQVEGSAIRNEVPTTVPGAISFRTVYWPIKRNSIFLLKNGGIFVEETDFHVSYQTGVITLFAPMAAGDLFSINYVPLAEQANDLTYDSSNWYCTVHDSRLVITNAANFQLSITNPNVNLADATVLRVYNETRDGEYDLSGASYSGQRIQLAADASNTAIGLSSGDLVVADYKFVSQILEYAPVMVNNLVVAENSSSVYLEGVNIPQLFPVGAILRLGKPDAGTAYYFHIDSSSFTGTDTKIGLSSSVPEYLTNPTINVSDDPISFLLVPLKANPFMSQSTSITFPGRNIRRIFRRDTLLKIGNDLYSVAGATYDHASRLNIVTLNSETVHDYVDDTVLSSIKYSDFPLYNEGDTELAASMPVVSVPPQPGLVLNLKGTGTIPYVAGTLALSIGSYSFDYSSNPTFDDMSRSISLSPLTNLQVGTYIPAWPSRRLSPAKGSLYLDSSAVINALPELRLDGTDTTSFSLSATGGLSLANGLVREQRYNLDYMGQAFIGDGTVSFSADYFVTLAKGSKVQASFQYDNLDQFYVEVMSRRDFFETVTIPRMKDEAQQLNGNVGQGGDVPTDENQTNSQGGITNDEYRRQDAEIECRIMKNIYDFFSNRVKAYGDEMLAAEGVRLFNNDGMFTDAQQLQATKVYNRIFPNTDYTGLPPLRVSPLTGEFYGGRTYFTQGSMGISCATGSHWLTQLAPGDFIGRSDSTRHYKIASIIDDGNLTISSAFGEASTTNSDGDTFVASSGFPAYDDNGHMGAKLVGTRSDNFGLNPVPLWDTFDCYIDGSYCSYTFKPPVFPPIDPISLFIYTLFNPARLTGQQIASALSGSNDRLYASYETVLNPNNAYGFSQALVLRTIPPYNVLVLGNGSAVSKLGFTPGDSAIGNLDRTDHAPETVLLRQENEHLVGTVAGYVQSETGALGQLIIQGILDKLNRLNYLGDATEIHRHAGDESSLVTQQISRVWTEIGATSVIMGEPSKDYQAYGDATYAQVRAYEMLSYDTSAAAMDASVWPLWNGIGNTSDSSWKWPLDFDQTSLYVRGIDSQGIGVPVSSGPGIMPIDGTNAFYIVAPADYDRRILNVHVMPDGSSCDPKAVYEDTSGAVPGNWTGWYSGHDYSLNPPKVKFNFNANDLFVINRNPIVSGPLVLTTVPGSLKLYWIEKTAFTPPTIVTFPFPSHTTVGSLALGINDVSGFSTQILNSSSGYSYGNLFAQAVPATPMATIYTGTQSPAVSVGYKNQYQSTASALILGDYTFGYSTYTTLGSLSAAILAQPGINVSNVYASDYPSSQLNVASGVMAPSAPLYFSSNPLAFNISSTQGSPRYRAFSNHLELYYYNPSDTTSTLDYTFATLADFANAINSISGFSTSFTYSNQAFTPVDLSPTGVVPISGITPLFLNSTFAMTVSEPVPSYACDTTALAVDMTRAHYEFPYSTYSSLGSLVSAVGSTPLLTASSFFNPGYSFSYLNSQSGALTTSGVTVYFDAVTHRAPLCNIFFDMTNFRYSVDTTALNIFWDHLSVPYENTFRYTDYTTILSVKNAVSAITRLDATGYSGYDLLESRSFKLASGTINPDATITSGLRPMYVTYATISDRWLTERLSYITGREDQILPRIQYLDSTREPQIRRDMTNEELLRTSTGDPGDLWIWANNRFNRRQGCEARLSQINKQIESNQSALEINRYMAQ